MEKMDIYNKSRTVPNEAIKPIQGGRLKGMSDINPMWRIEVLTEMFGPCGIGWKAPIKRTWTEAGGNGEICAFCEIELHFRCEDGNWSEAIDGTGGNMLVEKETGGLHTNDEAFKMAYTDAIGVACKMLGIGADVYWGRNDSKYSRQADKPTDSRADRPSDIEYARAVAIKYGKYAGRKLGDLTATELDEVAAGENAFLKKHANALIANCTVAMEEVDGAELPWSEC